MIRRNNSNQNHNHNLTTVSSVAYLRGLHLVAFATRASYVLVFYNWKRFLLYYIHRTTRILSLSPFLFLCFKTLRWQHFVLCSFNGAVFASTEWCTPLRFLSFSTPPLTGRQIPPARKAASLRRMSRSRSCRRFSAARKQQTTLEAVVVVSV